MKKINTFKTFLIFVALSLSQNLVAQGIPEILYYKFNDTGKTIRNLASNPPKNAATATIYGSIKQGSTGACSGTALVGSGNSANSEYVDTHWKDSLRDQSWTISFYLRNLDSSTTANYLFSDTYANGFMCLSGGAAGAGNISLYMGGVPFNLPGGCGKLPRVCTFVWNQSSKVLYAYLNGKQVNSTNRSSAWIMSTSGTFWLLGKAQTTSASGLKAGGIMDEFRVYNRALSATEISKLLYYGMTYSTTALCGVSSFKSPSGKYTWTKPGTYYDTILNNGYCDSIMTFVMTGSNHSSATIKATACDFYVSPSKRYTWTKSGTYTDVIKNKGGCDSNLTINLTVNLKTFKQLNVTNCYSYKSPTGKYTWTKTGKYNDTMINAKGCDSIFFINLTIGNASFDTIYEKGCDKYTSPSGKYIWANSGIYTDTLINSLGCDSILTVYLTISNSSKNAMKVKVCDKYKSPGGKTGWVTSGIYKDTLINKAGCDSIITIDLTVNKSSFIQISPNTCGKYISPSGKYSATISGMFYDTIPNSQGCDSVLLIDVKINSGTKATISPIACLQFVSPSKKHVWKTSGNYLDTLLNRKGCDSIVTINLTVNTVNVGVSQSKAKLTALFNGGAYQWLDCNKNYAKISGATAQQYTATTLGKYSVEVNDGKCIDTSSCYSVTDLGVGKTSLINLLSVYPNPSSGQYTLSSAKPLNKATVIVTNSLGEIVAQMDNMNGNSFVVDISDKSSGIYLIEIKERENFGRIKVLKF